MVNQTDSSGKKTGRIRKQIVNQIKTGRREELRIGRRDHFLPYKFIERTFEH